MSDSEVLTLAEMVEAVCLERSRALKGRSDDREYLILAMLEVSDRLPSEVAEYLNFDSPGTASKILGPMEMSGLISRRIDQSDKRRQILSLTDAGRRELGRRTHSGIRLVASILRQSVAGGGGKKKTRIDRLKSLFGGQP